MMEFFIIYLKYVIWGCSMKKNVGAIYPCEQNFEVYKKYIQKLQGEGSAYFQDNKESLKEVPWVCDEKLIKQVVFPSITHSFLLYKGLYFLLEGKRDQDELLQQFVDVENIDYVKQLIIKSIIWVNSETKSSDEKNELKNIFREEAKAILQSMHKSGEITLIKGSIYKIKRYFLENNNISDIRGGSMLIDYLNNECIQEYLKAEANGLCEECLVYSGGGNILLMVPQGQGAKVCGDLEQKFFDVAVTAMNAFEFIETNIVELLFNFKECTRNLNNQLKEREKNKIYDFEPEPTLIETINIDGEKIEFKVKREVKDSLCKLCNIREAYYTEKVDEETVPVCPSCQRKHATGKKKSKHFKEYEAYLREKDISSNQRPVRTLDDMKDDNGMIAVLYGDGNNMGNIVLNIEAPYEMMFFSDLTDKIIKESVYGAIHSVMGQEVSERVRVEVLAVGGDDLFFIVPAEYAPALAAEVVKRFDTAFNPKDIKPKEKVTMSVGVCIGKYNMPIKSMFEIAQDSMKKAKKVVREQISNESKSDTISNADIEGTIDIVEINGAQSIINDENYKGIFPLEASRLVSALEGTGGLDEWKIRLYDYSYAQQIMAPEEFRLYFNYKEAQFKKSHKESTTSYLRKVFRDNANIHLQAALSNGEGEDIPESEKNYYPNKAEIWADLLILLKYRRGVK